MPLWKQFGVSLALAVTGVAFAVKSWLRGNPARNWPVAGHGLGLVFLWSAVMLVATVSQVRFSYYLGVSVALFAGSACDLAMRWVERLRPKGVAGPQADVAADAAPRVFGVARAVAVIVLSVAVAAAAAKRFDRDRHAESEITEDWFDAMSWMRDNTPEPFGDASAYFRTRADDLGSAASQRAAYGVMTNWPGGYWVTRIARRIPNANPRQTQVAETSSFMLAEDPAEGGRILDALRSRYVVLDMPLLGDVFAGDHRWFGSFYGVAKTAGRWPGDYCELFETAGGTTSRTYCYPKYYRTMAVRLYAFGGRAILPEAVSAIRVGPPASRSGLARVLGERSFPSYDAADLFIRSRPGERWRIASSDPLVSCVPLVALNGYVRVYRASGTQQANDGRSRVPTLQIYEYRGAATTPGAGSGE